MNAPDFCVFRFLPIPKTPKPTQEPFLLSPTEKALMGATNREIWRLYQEALHNHSNYEKTTETADLNPTTCTAEALVQAENNPLVATFWGGRCVIPVSEAHRRLHTYITGRRRRRRTGRGPARAPTARPASRRASSSAACRAR